MKVTELIERLKELPGDAIVMDFSDFAGGEVLDVKYEPVSQTVWVSKDMPESGIQLDTILTPEKHLAAILFAWQESDGVHIHKDLRTALTGAEADFDGVEGY
jgi:hypothetical protein